MLTKTKSVKYSIALAMAWHTLELKSRRNCSSSVADETLLVDLPLDSVGVPASVVREG